MAKWKPEDYKSFKKARTAAESKEYEMVMFFVRTWVYWMLRQIEQVRLGSTDTWGISTHKFFSLSTYLVFHNGQLWRRLYHGLSFFVFLSQFFINTLKITLSLQRFLSSYFFLYYNVLRMLTRIKIEEL